MGVLSWIVLGLIAGLVAKLIMPGRDPGGVVLTILIGIVGALAGGFISTRLGLGTVTGVNFRSVLIAIGGAVLLLAILRAMRRRA
ncbi:MAG TPA: GlsB/YeaQ/YmgE family stress response membrane protein [Dongiaceae bacterium]|nr:GlsB/YeaQ/YmgE family stress response membrane protein [Dongiaceae bacterium]